MGDKAYDGHVKTTMPVPQVSLPSPACPTFLTLFSTSDMLVEAGRGTPTEVSAALPR